MMRAVTLIPGTTEFGYEPATVVRKLGPGKPAPENRHVAHAPSDVIASLDELQALCPNLERVAIVVAWFGDDLRAGACRDPARRRQRRQGHRTARPGRWPASVAATPIWSRSVDGRPAYGGTPSDDSVRHLIAELKARGLKVTLYPFVMMDVPADNALPDPWTGAAPQPALSVARPHHLRSGAGRRRLAGRHRGARRTGRCVLRGWRR